MLAYKFDVRLRKRQPLVSLAPCLYGSAVGIARIGEIMIAAALLIGTLFFVIFGALSDHLGCKSIIMAGCLIAALACFPI